jgi:hypothetical protein
MQHAVDLHRCHGSALQRGQQDAAQRVAEGQAETALERLGDQGRKTVGSLPGENSSLFGLISSCQFFWIVTVSSLPSNINVALEIADQSA